MAIPTAARPLLGPATLILLGGAFSANGWPGADCALGQATAGPGSVEDRPATPDADEQAIRAFNEAFVGAYNRGDAQALSAMFAEDAEVFEADGARYQGRGLIERSYAEIFEAEPGARLELEAEELRFLTPEVAKEEGTSVVSPADGPPVSHLYTALFVKRDGRWLLASVREESAPLVRPRERLGQLEWLVGEWVDEGPESEARVDCRWSADGNFLLRDFSVTHAGEVVLSVSQRIGWDPIAGTFLSWEFDSEGGFGEGTWARDGDRWVVSETGVRPEGLAATSTRVLERIGPDQVRWTLLDRMIDGEAVPGEERSVLTRVPPAPNLGVEARPAQSSTTSSPIPTGPNPEGSPR